MLVDRDRENQLSGCAARVQQGRKNINGSGVVILVALRWGNFFGAMTSLGLLAKQYGSKGGGPINGQPFRAGPKAGETAPKTPKKFP